MEDVEKAAMLSEVCWKAFPSPTNLRRYKYALLLSGKGDEIRQLER